VNAAADAVTRLLDGGTLRIYSGRQPAAGDTPVTDQVMLAELQFGAPAFSAAERGVATSNELTADKDAPGGDNDATWFRAFGLDGAPIFDGTVGMRKRGDVANLLLNATHIPPGAIVTATVTYRQPMRETVRA